MTTNSLHSILYRKYQEKSLASLYITNYDSRLVDPEAWVEEFLSLFSKISDHPDVLKIYKTEKETEYKVDSKSIQEFLKFLNYRPLQLEKRFIFIYNAQDISVILSNKLLKIFEELPPHFCLFLMVPDNAFMLPTVLSRAIKLQIPSSNAEIASEQNFKDIKTPQDLLATQKLLQGTNAFQNEKIFIEQTIGRCFIESTYQELDELLAVLKDNETYTNFNNSKLSRMTRFFP
jgi:DNA polymerase-3 subunit delta'